MPDLEAAVKSRPASGSSSLTDRVQSLRLPPPARTGSARLPWALALLMTAAAAYFALGGKLAFLPQPLSKTETTTVTVPEGATVTVGESVSTSSTGTKPPASAAASAGKIVLESKGWIIPEQQILVSPQVSGRVIQLNFEAGQNVEKGFVLAVLDSTEYRAEYARAEAEVASANERYLEAKQGSRPDEIRQAQAEFDEAKTQLDQALRTYQRRKDLFQQKIVTSQDVEDAESQYQALVKRVDRLSAGLQLMIDGPRSERKRAAEADLRRAQAELARAQWRLDNTTIYAPISGTILKKNAELGNLVNPIAFNGSFSLCDMADLSKLEVELSIQERDIAKVFKNQKCRLRSEAYPERVYDGFVSRLLPIADRAKGAVPVRVRITIPADEKGQYLKPEMGATVTFFQETVAPTTEAQADGPVDALQVTK